MGKLYGIGVGSGDSDLLTIRAVRTLEKLDVLYTPQAKKGGESTAMGIVSDYLREDLIVKERHFPMNYNDDEKIEAWDMISREIEIDVKEGLHVGFITLGDPMVYSTYVYLLERLINEIEIETIPGISSFINISSSNNFPLVMDRESLAVVSCTDKFDRLSYYVDDFDCLVLMKVYKNFKDVVDLIVKKELSKNAIMVSNSSMENEIVYEDISEALKLEKVPYFSTILINKKWKRK